MATRWSKTKKTTLHVTKIQPQNRLFNEFDTKTITDYKFKQLCKCCKKFFLVKRFNNLRIYCPDCCAYRKFDPKEKKELESMEKKIALEKRYNKGINVPIYHNVITR